MTDANAAACGSCMVPPPTVGGCIGPAWNGKDGSAGSVLPGVSFELAFGVRPTSGDPSVVGDPLTCATGGADDCSVGVELMSSRCLSVECSCSDESPPSDVDCEWRRVPRGLEQEASYHHTISEAPAGVAARATQALAQHDASSEGTGRGDEIPS